MYVEHKKIFVWDFIFKNTSNFTTLEFFGTISSFLHSVLSSLGHFTCKCLSVTPVDLLLGYPLRSDDIRVRLHLTSDVSLESQVLRGHDRRRLGHPYEVLPNKTPLILVPWPSYTKLKNS